MKVRFGRFVLDAPARRLTRDRQDARLSPKAFDLLVLLVERRPAVMNKKTLREQLWPGTHVVDASLSNLVAEIRALGGGEEPPPIRTVHGIGYAFAGDVEVLEADDGPRSPVAAACWVVWRDRPIPLTPGHNLVGRDASCAVWLDESGVSRRHARIAVPAGRADASAGATIEDLNSTNGTFVSGQRVTGAVRLQDGDRLQLGSEVLIFRTRAAIDAPTKRVARD
jgi:DNA-binding winged helix-turn-helix (wHTH) protein